MSITYLEAIREAQARALAEDPRVFIYGQDVGAFGGVIQPEGHIGTRDQAVRIGQPLVQRRLVPCHSSPLERF